MLVPQRAPAAWPPRTEVVFSWRREAWSTTASTRTQAASSSVSPRPPGWLWAVCPGTSLLLLYVSRIFNISTRYIPHGGSTRVCQPWEALNFTETLAGLSAGDCKRCLCHDSHKHKHKVLRHLFRSCLPDCSTVIYSFTQSSAPFRRCNSYSFLFCAHE